MLKHGTVHRQKKCLMLTKHWCFAAAAEPCLTNKCRSHHKQMRDTILTTGKRSTQQFIWFFGKERSLPQSMGIGYGSSFPNCHRAWVLGNVDTYHEHSEVCINCLCICYWIQLLSIQNVFLLRMKMERLPANATVCKERIGAYEQMQEPAMTVIYQGFWCWFFWGVDHLWYRGPRKKD